MFTCSPLWDFSLMSLVTFGLHGCWHHLWFLYLWVFQADVALQTTKRCLGTKMSIFGCPFNVGSSSPMLFGILASIFSTSVFPQDVHRDQGLGKGSSSALHIPEARDRLCYTQALSLLWSPPRQLLHHRENVQCESVDPFPWHSALTKFTQTTTHQMFWSTESPVQTRSLSQKEGVIGRQDVIGARLILGYLKASVASDWLQNRWLKTTEIHWLTVLEPRRPK
jgi:hypothetical protein